MTRFWRILASSRRGIVVEGGGVEEGAWGWRMIPFLVIWIIMIAFLNDYLRQGMDGGDVRSGRKSKTIFWYGNRYLVT